MPRPCLSVLWRDRAGTLILFVRVERALLPAAFDLAFAALTPWKSGASAPRKPHKSTRALAPDGATPPSPPPPHQTPNNTSSHHPPHTSPGISRPPPSRPSPAQPENLPPPRAHQSQS